jgi:hypothetical protein
VTDEGSIAFGLNKYGGLNGRAAFEADYRLAIIDAWQPTNTNYWFASVLRSALAHGQARPWPNVRIRLYNVQANGNKNFDITMREKDFERLIITAIDYFVRTVGPVGGFYPRSRVLEMYMQGYAAQDDWNANSRDEDDYW